jgi:hypothetical protein
MSGKFFLSTFLDKFTDLIVPFHFSVYQPCVP